MEGQRYGRGAQKPRCASPAAGAGSWRLTFPLPLPATVWSLSSFTRKLAPRWLELQLRRRHRPPPRVPPGRCFFQLSRNTFFRLKRAMLNQAPLRRRKSLAPASLRREIWPDVFSPRPNGPFPLLQDACSTGPSGGREGGDGFNLICHQNSRTKGCVFTGSLKLRLGPKLVPVLNGRTRKRNKRKQEISLSLLPFLRSVGFCFFLFSFFHIPPPFFTA